MGIDPNQLPNDPAALRQIVVGLLEEAAERERRLRQLQHWLEQLLRARYGPRRERVDEHQLFLFAAKFQQWALILVLIATLVWLPLSVSGFSLIAAVIVIFFLMIATLLRTLIRFFK